ncbi:16S rRNA (uracil(1498)-N(3))-methyltransferase [Aquiluna sp.]|nr:RsmE family RNA methyltransferase [Aquiluna sp.]MDB4254503.1 16S rRNA (uracil(1498)-N(3))-methyltransferase [Aquiluna sp.]
MHWFYDPEITESSTAIFERELTHFKALRIRNDDQIVITNGLGVSHKAVVVDVSSGQIRLLAKSIANEQSVTIHLVQALAKGGRDEAAVQNACELGVASVTPFQAKRSIVEWGSKTARNQERWHQIAVSAMKQSQQSFLPTIGSLSTAKDLVGSGLKLVLDPGAEKSLSEIDLSPEITIVVGPEGGFEAGELNLLMSNGFKAVRLGNSVLRTSSAGPAAIAAIQALSGSWNNG